MKIVKNKKIRRAWGYRKYGRKRAFKEKRYGIVKQLNYNGFHCFKEKTFKELSFLTSGDGTAMLSSTTGTTGWSQKVPTWKLDDLTDIANYRGLFDEYRLTGVKLKFFPQWDNAATDVAIVHDTVGQETLPSGGAGNTFDSETTGNNQSSNIPIFFYNKDRNEASNPSTLANMMEKDPKMVRWNKPISVYITNPTVLNPVVKDPNLAPSLTNQVRKPMRSPWLSLATGTPVEHLGLECGICSADVNTRYQCNVLVTYYFQCKGNV